MTVPQYWLEETAERIRQAASRQETLSIQGGGSKSFYGNAARGEVLHTGAYRGIVDYDPRELTITVRAGTPLAELESSLDEHQQMLPFEPPSFGQQATIGGCVSVGLSGPRRAYACAVRDAILGIELLDGRGQKLRFGGRVIKNVAGYDVSRLVVGAMGTLGVLAELSCKLLPRPACERTLALEMPQNQAITLMNQWAGSPLPLSATVWLNGRLIVRLSGAETAVAVAVAKLGGEEMPGATEFWNKLKEHGLPEFAVPTLWRLSVPSTTQEIAGTFAVEWGGALRWVADGSDMPRQYADKEGGHATLFRSAEQTRFPVFSTLAPAMMELQQRIRQTFDPYGVFDAARL